MRELWETSRRANACNGSRNYWDASKLKTTNPQSRVFFSHTHFHVLALYLHVNYEILFHFNAGIFSSFFRCRYTFRKISRTVRRSAPGRRFFRLLVKPTGGGDQMASWSEIYTTKSYSLFSNIYHQSAYH